ncbi:Mur ligase domain-containing protein [Streptomyces sp. NPDC091215]|uniref:UDP-N-acetylmuramate--L-alanine ligase n=1 Tax=Streptomyces sp. NPDC091215 TaxID=3155192 RepID=UPI003446604D
MAETAVPRTKPTVSADDLLDLTRVHFIGVGGTGMLPIARVCVEGQHSVSGSDHRTSEGLKELARLGAAVHTGHAAENVPADATAVVFTHAIGPDNPEIQEAQLRGIPVAHRSTVLHALMSTHRAPVAVMGTHGKSSTAGMMAFALDRMGQVPGYVVGADLDEPGSGGRSGAGGIFVAEVDESDRSHIGVSMKVAVITNIAHDHPENYAAEADHVDAYEECVRTGTHEDGTLVLNADSPGCRELASRLAMSEGGPRVVTFGMSEGADWRLVDAFSVGGRGAAMLRGPGGRDFELALHVPGVHQLLNAAAAVAALDILGQDRDLAVHQLLKFRGVARRMTPAGETAGVSIWDSYAHHPDEVSADLAAARSLAGPAGRVIVVFQPSDQVRLTAFGTAFGKALAGADEVVLTDSTSLLAARSLERLANQIGDVGGNARWVERDRAEAVDCAAVMAQPGDAVVLMGTGDIADAAPMLRAALDKVFFPAA